jgi:uncharacterized protein YbaP (TraB family)
MRVLFAAGVILFGLLPGGAVAAQQVSTFEELDTVLVTGEHPGPGLWKISKGDHVMWVLGTYGPLPKGMTWRSQAVEARIAESKEVILPATAEVDVDVGFFRMLTLIPTMVKSVYLPDKATLKDVLPSATWEKWWTARQQYIGRSDATDRLRPSMAIMTLRDKAYGRNRLTDGPEVEAVVKSAAKKHKVRVRSLRDVEPRMKMKTDDIRMALSGVRDAADVECFTRDLENLEADIEQLKLRANAWATGDIEALRHLHEQPDIGSACDDMFEESFATEDSVRAVRLRQLGDEYERLEMEAREGAQREWVVAARKALEKNPSTFAVLPIREVVAANGYVAKLAELGYEVEGQ